MRSQYHVKRKPESDTLSGLLFLSCFGNLCLKYRGYDLLANAELLGDGCRDSLLVYDDIHCPTGYEVVRSIPDTLVLTGFAP